MKSPDLVDFADLTEDQLALLVDLSRKVNSRLDLQTILRRVVEHSILLAGAERGFLFLSDGTSHLKVKVALDACGNDILDEPVRISSGVVSAMLAHGIPIFLEDVRLNSDFSGRRSLESMGVKYVLGIPLKSRSHILGFIYVDNTRSSRQFTGADRKILTSFADQAALAIENAQLRRHSLRAESEASIGRLADLLLGDMEEVLGSLDGVRRTIGSGQGDRPSLAAADRLVAIAMDRMGRRIDEVKDFREMQAGEIEILLGPVDLDAMVAEEVRGLDRVAGSARVKTHLSLNIGRTIMLDGRRTGRAVGYILRRAIGAATRSERPEIAVTTAPSPDGILLEVRDNGPVLTEEEVDGFFEPFGAGRWAGSSGPGMAVVRGVMEKLTGRIEVSSGDLDGTCVRIGLPTGLRPSMFPRRPRTSNPPTIPPTVPPPRRSGA